MRQLLYIKKRKLEWHDASEPSLESPDDALVRPVAVARCDLDRAFLLHDLPSAIRLGATVHWIDPLAAATFGAPAFAGPFPFGHECVAEVVQIGDRVRGLAVADLVVVPFQVSCGACSSCQRSLTAHCTTDRPARISVFGFGKNMGGWGGAVSDLLRVPHAGHMLLRVPEGSDPAGLASCSDNVPDGWRTVAPHLAACPEAPVLIVGGMASSVGLYAAASAVALGSTRVDYVDSSRARLEIAQRLGANPIEVQHARRFFACNASFIRGGYPIAVDASGMVGALTYAIRSLSPGGVCTSVAFYLRRGTPLPLWSMYINNSRFETGFANVRDYLPAVLEAVRAGRLRPELVTTLIASWEDAPRALLERTTKVVIMRAPICRRGA